MASGDEDYRHIGLSLRHHPLNFLRENPGRRRIVICAGEGARDSKWLTTADIVLMRQKPRPATS